MTTAKSPSDSQRIATSIAGVGVLICSCDQRKDVLARVLPSILRFWPDCAYPIYVGVNTREGDWAGTKPLLAPPSNWRTECLEQVSQMPESHLIVLLDDFLFFSPVNQSQLSMLVSIALGSGLKYLRLQSPGRSLLQRIVGRRTKLLMDGIQEVNERRPFYSGLQIAVWEKSHFVSLLRQKGTIWEFEHYRAPEIRHYAITGSAPIAYQHLIEKGRWLPYSKSLLRRAGLPEDLGSRPAASKLLYALLLIDEVRFFLLGYSIRLGK